MNTALRALNLLTSGSGPRVGGFSPEIRQSKHVKNLARSERLPTRSGLLLWLTSTSNQSIGLITGTLGALVM